MRALFILLSLILISCGGGEPKQLTDRPITKTQEEIYDLVNSYRSSRGLRKLEWHYEAINQAQRHSVNMARGRTSLGHSGVNDRYRNIRNADSSTISKLGENVARNQSAKAAFNAWKLSYKHHLNIVGDYTHTGIGAERKSDGKWYFTQIFLKKQ
jgi:uncharacterized protein YkwD